MFSQVFVCSGWGGSSVRGGSVTEPPRYGNVRVVRILLECFLVRIFFYISPNNHNKIGPWVLCCFKEVGSEVFLAGTQETSFIVWFSQYQPLFFKVTTIVVTVI